MSKEAGSRRGHDFEPGHAAGEAKAFFFTPLPLQGSANRPKGQ